MTGVFTRDIQTQRHTEGRRSDGDGGRNGRCAITNQGMPRVDGSYQKVEEAKKESSLELLEGAWPC